MFLYIFLNLIFLCFWLFLFIWQWRVTWCEVIGLDFRRKNWKNDVRAYVYGIYYDLGFELSERHALVLSNIRELNRVPKYKMSTLYTNYWWSVLHSFSPTLMTICLPWGQHVLTIPYDIIISRTFYVVPLHHMSMWPIMTINDLWCHLLSSLSLSKIKKKE